jgi:hypothetical protein
MGHLCQEEAAMALLQKGVATVTQWMPKVLSPRAHAIADYATVGTAALFSILFWNRNRNAAVAALLSAAAEAGVSLITDYPGGLFRLIDFPTHGKIDFGLAAAAFAMPDLMRFNKDPESRALRLLGLNITTVAGLTDFEGETLERGGRRAA